MVTAGIAAIAALALASTGLGTGQAHGATGARSYVEAPKAIDPYRITGLIYSGRADSALAILNSSEYEGTPDPMVYLLRARSLRDQLSDEDDNKKLVAMDAAAVAAQLDTAITLCDEVLKHDATDPIYLYYRGRARLGKAQVNVLTRSYWSAGRNAGKAKSDLEKYLEHVPDSGDAHGDLGAFLYFADTLPGVIKFVSRLLLFPTGDRERGLEMLNFAAATPCVFQVDYQIAVAAIDLLFEGVLERGVTAMRALVDERPQYTRLVEPFGVLAPLDPLRIREYQRLEDFVLATRLDMAGAWMDWGLIRRIQLHRAYADMYFRSPSAALDQFTEFIDDPEERPDWALPLALINRGQLYAKSGRTDEALAAFQAVLATDTMSHFHDLAGQMTKSLGEPWKVVDLKDLDFIAAIYDGDVEVARAGLKEYGRRYGRDVIFYFYLGEIEVFGQDFVAAQRAYETCLSAEVEGGDQSYQMYAALRLAEVSGLQGRYKEAKHYAEKADEYIHVGYLLDFMIESRQRYYELLENGTLGIQPTILLKDPADHSSTPQATHQ
jgi:tetratricopeptide (TPR) repeat protein